MNKYLLAGYRLFAGNPVLDSDEEAAGQKARKVSDEECYIEEVCAGLIFSHTPGIYEAEKKQASETA